MNTESSSWGKQSLRLKLPTVLIQFDGLSHKQRAILSKCYLNFVDRSNRPADLSCHVHHLPRAPQIGTDQLTYDQQYAPKKVRHAASNSLQITGVNFEARFALDASCASSLGVAHEKELTYANVIENYLRIVSAYRVLPQQGVILHSAGLVFDNKAYIFSGRSNAGKTTLARKAHTAGATILSDDINLVLPGPSGYAAYAVPFTGEFGRTLGHAGGRESYPLAGIILLEQGETLRASPVSKALAVARLLSGCPFVNTDEHESEALFASLTSLVNTVPVIRLLNRRHDEIDDIMVEVHVGLEKMKQ